MKKPICECKNCKERHVGCHVQCEKYLKFKAELEIYNAEVLAIKKAESDMTSYEIERLGGKGVER